MISMTLYKREMKGSVKLLVIFGAVITLYVSIIISMYAPEMMHIYWDLWYLTSTDSYCWFSRCCSVYCAEMP